MGLLDSRLIKEVKKLARNNCANYVSNICIESDKPCHYFTAHGANISCDYFEQAVLPSEPLLEQEYKTAHGINYVEDKPVTVNVGKCNRCGDEFVKGSNRALYCNPCKTEKQREHNRRTMRNKRIK